MLYPSDTHVSLTQPLKVVWSTSTRLVSLMSLMYRRAFARVRIGPAWFAHLSWWKRWRLTSGCSCATVGVLLTSSLSGVEGQRQGRVGDARLFPPLLVFTTEIQRARPPTSLRMFTIGSEDTSRQSGQSRNPPQKIVYLLPQTPSVEYPTAKVRICFLTSRVAMVPAPRRVCDAPSSRESSLPGPRSRALP